jgi:uncharacterized UBP type Zn finger protein
MTKTMQHVEFSEYLDLSRFCAFGDGGASFSMDGRERKPCHIPYKLMSVIEHKGDAFAGHYQTYRRAPGSDENKWVLISDQSVVPISWRDVRNCQAYMLFYEAV